MSSIKTPTLNKTPFRRLGLARRRTKSATITTPTTTPILAVTSPPVECLASSQNVSGMDAHAMRPIRSTCSIGDDSNDDDDVSMPVTPVNTKAVSRKTRLSLSQNWRNKITSKKQMLNVKRRKLLGEVEMCSETDITEENVAKIANTLPNLGEDPNLNSLDCSKPSTTRQRIEEVKQSIDVWRVGCIQALTDLQEIRGSGDMESLLNSLQIPFDLVNYDRENQEFLDPD